MNRTTGPHALLKSLTCHNRSLLQPAFTLIELLITAAVIAILLSLLLPATLRAKSGARQARCRHNVHQLGLGLAQFTADNHVYPLAINKAFLNGGYPEHHFDWIEALEYNGLSASKNSRFYEEGVWRCPSASRPSEFPDQWRYGSYGYNAFGMTAMRRPQAGDLVSGAPLDLLGLGGDTRTPPGISPLPISETEVAQPSGMMAIGESFSGSMDFIPIYGYRLYDPHQGKVNVLFCDGHVESPSVKALFVDTNDTALSRWNRDNQPHRECLAP